MSAIPSRHALVTGGAGFLGSHLCERLLRRRLRGPLPRQPVTGAPGNVAHLRGRPGSGWSGPTSPTTCHVPGAVDSVLHFASPASPVDYLRLPIETLRGRLARHAARAGTWPEDKGARFLLASTSETYGDPQVHPQPESYWGHVNPVGPRGVYDEAKRFAEAMTMAYRRQHGVDTAIVRIFNTYGPRMRPRRRPGHPDLHPPGAGRRAADRGGRRQPDPLGLLRRRPVEGILAVAAVGPRRTGQHRQPRGALRPRPRRASRGTPSARRSDDRVHRPPGGRPDGPPPGHHAGPRQLGWEPQVPFAEGLARTVEWFRDTPPSDVAGQRDGVWPRLRRVAGTLPLTGRVALVTGAASGTRRATSIALAEAGAHVVVADVNEAGGKETCASVPAGTGTAEFARLDVTDDENRRGVVADLFDRHGDAFDLLVNVAGIDRPGYITDIDLADYRQVQAVNCEGPIFLTSEFMKRVQHLPEGRTADVVHIVSLLAITSGSGAIAYNGSKAGFRNATACIQRELREKAIRTHDGAERPFPCRVQSADPGGDGHPHDGAVGHPGPSDDAAVGRGGDGAHPGAAAPLLLRAGDADRAPAGARLPPLTGPARTRSRTAGALPLRRRLRGL